MKKRKPVTILTVGHSNRTLDAFLELIKAHSVKKIADVRTVPRSRKNPQFDRDALPDALKAGGIGYIHMPGLGGLRHAKKDSINTGWRNASFRGFADYMQTEEFEENIEGLISLAEKEEGITVMCAEALPWRCHRSLIADALLVRRIQVSHIMSKKRAEPHRITEWARVRGERITYPLPEEAEKA